MSDFEFKSLPAGSFIYNGTIAVLSCYEVSLDGVVLGTVAKAETKEWVVRNTKGGLWDGYGKSRKEAAKALTYYSQRHRFAAPEDK